MFLIRAQVLQLLLLRTNVLMRMTPRGISLGIVSVVRQQGLGSVNSLPLHHVNSTQIQRVVMSTIFPLPHTGLELAPNIITE